MYQLVITHELPPGGLPAMLAYYHAVDEARAKANPAYKPPRRYATVFGSGFQVVSEHDLETLPPDMGAYMQNAQTDIEKSYEKLIVPGRSEIRLLKQL